MEKLYRILSYKYLGLSLQEIRSQLETDGVPESLACTLHQQIREMEATISEQIRRYAVLKNLESLSHKDTVAGGWKQYMDTVEYLENKWYLIWQINKAFEEDYDAIDDSVSHETNELKEYYKIISDTVQLMNQHVPPEDDRVIALIERYFALQESEAAEQDSAAASDLISIDPDIMKIGLSSIAHRWEEIKAYLSKASYYYMNKLEEDK